MSTKRLLIASSSPDEAITKWVLNTKRVQDKIDVVFINELLNFDIHDELNDFGANIRWYENNKIKISNKTHCLLNRVTYIPEVFNEFQERDKEYAKREFEAYLGFALNSFETVQNIAINGICERILSLPELWQLVHLALDLSVPEYYWGSKDYNPLTGDNLVISNIYNYLNWQVDLTQKFTGFCFKKPKGTPVFILSIGDEYLITTERKLTVEQTKMLEDAFIKIKTTFKYFMFELLVFIDNDELIFGCINIEIIQSQHNALFHDFLQKNLLKEYYKCLN